LHGRPFPHYDETLRSLAEEVGVVAAFDRMPIRDMSIPTDDDMEKILDLIDTSIQDDRPVYIHCLGGLGRTGTVVGCYLARHGLARGLEALDRIDFLRRYTEALHRPSPETRE
jgi:protein-tyrosine phosphatase